MRSLLLIIILLVVSSNCFAGFWSMPKNCQNSEECLEICQDNSTVSNACTRAIFYKLDEITKELHEANNPKSSN